MTRFRSTWVQHYTTDDIDDQLGSISDQIVRDVRSGAAESLTNELAQFRAAADLGRTVEGADVREALRHSNVDSVLVHDDPDDGRLVDGDRSVDHITHLAVAGAVPIRMIPGLDELRGPAGDWVRSSVRPRPPARWRCRRHSRRAVAQHPRWRRRSSAGERSAEPVAYDRTVPIRIPDALPARAVLEREGVRVMDESSALRQDSRSLQIGLLNLMPDKVVTETQLARLLGATPLQVELTLVRVGSHAAKTPPRIT